MDGKRFNPGQVFLGRTTSAIPFRLCPAVSCMILVRSPRLARESPLCHRRNPYVGSR
jgi:hypothetical protein